MFRREAIDAQKQKLTGDVFLTQPISFAVISSILATLVLFVAVFIFTGTYSRSERVVGQLVPSTGMVKLKAQQFGSLQNLHVEEGDCVHKGQVLANISTAQGTADGGLPIQTMLTSVNRQKTLLETQLILEQNQLEDEQAKLGSEQAELETRILSLHQQITLQQQITHSAEAAYKDVQDLLKKGYISKIESERRRQTWLAQQTQEQLRQQELTEAKSRQNQLAIRLQQLEDESNQRTARLQAQLSEFDSRQAELESRAAYSITAPVDGRVASITAQTLGSNVQAGQPLLAILPDNTELKAELYIPSRAAGFVEIGQEVRLLYDAFPYQQFGAYDAIITKVTETILVPNELQSPLPVKEPVYRVVASLDSASIQAGNKHIQLQNGMTLQANIILERRSFIDWLLAPLRAVTA